MYRWNNQKQMVNTVKQIKRFAKMPKKALGPGVQVRYVPTKAGRVRVLCFGFEEAAVRPVLFDLHGGGFVMGSAELDLPICRYLQRECGCKVVSIDYAKAPEAPYPQAVEEVWGVVQYFVRHAGMFGIDPERMAIGGHSAGGNLAAVTCLQSVEKGGIAFRCQILDYPPMDLSIDPKRKPCPKGAIKPWVARAFDACYLPGEQYQTDPHVSPVYADQAVCAGLPPALVIAAGQDSLHDEAVRYHALLRESGADSRLLEYPVSGHGFTMNDGPDTRDALEHMAAFLQEHLSQP